MTIRIRELTENERLFLLRNKIVPNNIRQSELQRRRRRIVLLASDGKTVPQIAEELGTRQETVRFWLKRFQRQGIPGLFYLPPDGRPVRFTPTIRRIIVDTALANPSIAGRNNYNWTYKKLARYLSKNLKIKISTTRLRDILNQELRLKDPRLVSRWHPRYERERLQYQLDRVKLYSSRFHRND